MAAGCDVASVFVNDDVGAESVAALARAGVTHISLRCAGYDNVDLQAAAAAGITVTRVPTYSPASVAEHALALTLALARNVARAVARCKESNYELSGLVGFQLRGKTVGIVGTGAIGTCAAAAFHGLGCRVVAFDPNPSPAARPYCSYVPTLDRLLAESDVVSLHVPLLPSTHHMINKESISRMKHGAVLVNVSRGALIDTPAVLDGLQSGRVGGLALDVYEREKGAREGGGGGARRVVGRGPPTPLPYPSQPSSMRTWARSSPPTGCTSSTEVLGWWRGWGRAGPNPLKGKTDPETVLSTEFAILQSLPNVVVTPHCAFLTTEALGEIGRTVAANIQDVAAGRPCANEVKAR